MMKFTAPKPKYVATFLVGLLAGLILVAAYQLLTHALAQQKQLSCHTPTTISTSTKYCVYFTKTSGILSTKNDISIGPSADRGIVYSIPYEPKDVKVTWSQASDTVIITMPDTKLTIASSEYVDAR